MSNMHHNHPESDERTPMPPVKTEPTEPSLQVKFDSDLADLKKSKFTDAQKKDVEEIMRGQQALGHNNAQFTKAAKIDASTWGRLRRGDYKSANLNSHIADLRLHCSNLFTQANMIRDRVAIGLTQKPYFETAEYTAVKEAINTCLADDGLSTEDKAIWVIGRYGAGKTALGRQILKGGVTGWMITARPTWRRSYFAFLQKLANVINLQTKAASAVALETEVIEYLQAHTGCVIFNEVESLHPDIWNFMRSVCNETGCAVLILITPEYYNQLKRRGGTGPSQLMRRGEGTFEIRDLTVGQVKNFFIHYWPNNPETAALSRRLAEEGNLFGAFSCVDRVIGMLLNDLHGSGRLPNAEILEKKITAYRMACPVPASALKKNAA